MTKVEELLSNRKFPDLVANGKTIAEIAAAIPGYSNTVITRARQSARKEGDFPERETTELQETVKHSGDTITYIGRSDTQIKTLPALLEHCGYDESEWDVPEWECNKWAVAAKDANKNLQVQELWQVKAKFKRKGLVIAARKQIEEMLESAKAGMPSYPTFRRLPSSKFGNLLEVSIPDLHVGKMAWGDECGENYDVQIAEDTFRMALETLLERSSTYPVERVLFVAGNDLVHIDNPRNTTYNGTPQDHDNRYQRTFARVRRLMTEAIDRLLPLADVDVLIVPGNHDETAAFHIGQCLECWYHNCKQVNVDVSPTLRKYYEWGEVMLMFTHGDKEPINKLGQIAAFEEKEMWGRTTYREVHIGHLHHTEVKDQPGITIRRLSSLSAADAYHKNMGYVGSPRRAEMLIWNKVEGLIGSTVYTVPPQGPDTH